MRDIAFFQRRRDYIDDLLSNRFTEPLLRDHPFYRNLILWVADHRAPLFYRMSDPKAEHFAFSGAYHFETTRESYDSNARQTLFFLHDFTHLLFPYAHDVSTVSREEFVRQFVYQERIASSETELLAYYRVPGLREKVFADEKLFYDVLVERGVNQPDPAWLLPLRDRIVMDDQFGQMAIGDHPQMLKWFRSWRRLTPKWSGERYDYMTQVPMPQFEYERLTVDTYEQVISSYRSQATQDDYERLILQNLHLGFALMGWDDPPTRFSQARSAVDRLEGAVFFGPRPA